MFANMSQVRAANRRSGQHWFDASTMAFFESRIESELFGGRFFVSSEQFVPSRGPAAPRMFTIREAHEDGSIETPSGLGGFQGHETLREALATILGATLTGLVDA